MALNYCDTTAICSIYESLFEQNSMAVYLLDGDRRFLRITPVIEKMTGYKEAELSGTLFDAIVFSGHDNSPHELFNGAAGVPVKREMFIKNNDSIPVKYVVTCISVAIPGDVRFIGIILPKQQPDQDMDEKIRVFSMAVEQSPATVVITDIHGSIEYVNPKFTHLTGYSFNEALRHNPRILKSGKQSPEFYRELWQTIISGKEWRGEFHNKKKNGEPYWESASISPIKNDKGEITHFVAVKEDITDRKKAEEELRITSEELKEKNDEMARGLMNAQMVAGLLLPVASPKHDRLRADFRFKPLDAIGGDFFSFNTLHEHGIGVFIGDVAGHGVSAALFLSLLRSLTDRLNAAAGANPSRYLKELNSALVDGGVFFFITALYGFFDLSEDGVEFRFAKGGHTPPILHRAGEGSAVILKSGGIPVGLSGTAVFQEITVDIKPGDRVYLYTDGVIEIRNEEGVMIEPEGLRDIIARSGAMSLKESLDYIMDEAGRFQGSRRVEDDIVLIGFEMII